MDISDFKKKLTPKELLHLAYERERTYPTGSVEINMAKVYKDYLHAITVINDSNKSDNRDKSSHRIREHSLVETFNFAILCQRADSDYIPHPCPIDGNTTTAENYLKRLREHYQAAVEELSAAIKTPSYTSAEETLTQDRYNNALPLLLKDLEYIMLLNYRVTKKLTNFTIKDVQQVTEISRRHKDKKLNLEDIKNEYI